MSQSNHSELTHERPSAQTISSNANRTGGVYAVLFALVGVFWSGGAVRADDSRVECFVYDDGYQNVAGPSDAVYFAGPQQACIPDGTATGTCRKWFGLCRTMSGKRPISFRVFNDGNSSMSSYNDSVYVPAAESACIPDGTSLGTCRRWFGLGGDSDGGSVSCQLFNDGYASPTNYTSAIYFRTNGQVCLPDGSSTGTCRKWFGRCVLVPRLL